MSQLPVRIGTRGSALALAQARLVAAALEREGKPSTLVIVETDGDRRAADVPWGEGAFVAAIEQALLDGRADLAVHSAKDVPTDEDPRLRISAYLPRADPRDALVVPVGSGARSLDDLPAGTRVGTDSPRRVGFVLARRPDLRPHPLHGNVDTRLRRLDDGETDALLIAAAGLDRLGRADRIAVRLDPEIVPPAPGQGAIAIQIRVGDGRMEALTGAIDDPDTRAAVTAERAFLAASGGGCRAPIGALAVVADGDVILRGGWTAYDGTTSSFGQVRGPASDAVGLGWTLAQQLGSRAAIAAGAGGREDERLPRPLGRVLVTRAETQADELIHALHEAGLDTVHVPSISIETVPSGGELDSAARWLASYDWVVLTSANAARALLTAAERVSTPFETSRFAVIGSATRRVLEHEGIAIDFQPSRAAADALGAELPLRSGSRVLLLRGDLADAALPAALRGWSRCHVDSSDLHRTGDCTRDPPGRVSGPRRISDAGCRHACRDDRCRSRSAKPGDPMILDVDAASPLIEGDRGPEPAPLKNRLRRLRRTPALRALVRETRLHPAMLVAPLFVRPGRGIREAIASLPGQARLSPDLAAAEAARLADLGVGGLILFGLPESKDPTGSGASADDGVVQDAFRRIRALELPLVTIADTCLCEYTDHGHCGPLAPDGSVDNDAALTRLAATAISQARAGADIVAPSAMMDGQVAAIRAALDAAGFAETAIMAYASKHASAFYGPFREAADSAPASGDRRGYQMDAANGREALQEMALDVDEGADILLVKPALSGLDLIAAARARFDLPIAAYQVSGEFAMIAAAAERGWLDGRRAMLEAVTSMARAGAGIILTYAAGDIAAWLQDER